MLICNITLIESRRVIQKHKWHFIETTINLVNVMDNLLNCLHSCSVYYCYIFGYHLTFLHATMDTFDIRYDIYHYRKSIQT